MAAYWIERMSTTITIEIDDDTAARLGDSPDAVTVAAKEAMVLELYRRHVISDWRASRLLGLDVGAFLHLASARGIPVIDLTPDEWARELETINRLWHS